MRSRYKGGAGRAATLAALGVSGALLVHSVYPQSLNPQTLNPQSPNPEGLNLRPGNYQVLATTDLPPQAAAALSPDTLARARQPQMRAICILDSNIAQGRDSELAQDLDLAGQSGDASCRLTQHSSSGNQIKFVIQCARSTLRFDGLFAVNSYRAILRMTSDQGQTTTHSLTAHRIGDCTAAPRRR
jgi:glucose/arabinose dehydrogenase